MVNDYILKLKEQAQEKKIPIIFDDVASFLTTWIKTHKIKYVFEIGTASSYSAHIMANAGAHVDTIERNASMIQLAKNNLAISPLRDHIQLIEDDATTYKVTKHYDLIFIDGAKSKYKHFFDTFHNHLSPNGAIICDNMFFHHLSEQEVGRNTKHLLRKLKAFEQYLLNHPSFDTEIVSIGDGISISRRKK